MNRLIARFYSGIIEATHILFVLAIAIIVLYLWNSDSHYPAATVGLIVLGIVVGWVVVFGFITTVVVMSNTMDEIRRQNEMMAMFLEDIASSVGGHTQLEPQAAPIRLRSAEPFIGSSKSR
ncbi:hypothetical protein KVP10_16640 [Candidimonas humi]|jgi:hypothetical protein|uniref:Uncharacterized protein n=1 Tax=Candidimonas humi TaxID=683355 RepID=A0ABV8NZ65_9BURK|nr:hypothetical protein [Candidimonas humi]MBV6306521.1 hypothetical protein [Candidimonas humi]